MKVRHPVKAIAASVLFSAVFVTSGAQADSGYLSVTVHGNDSYRQHSWFAEHDRYAGYAHNGRRVDRIQAHQRDHIHDGMRSGELTPREAARLLAEQREIERLQHQYMSDGYLMPYERQHLLAELDEASRNIWREKHDAQDRDDWPRWRGHR